MELNENQKAPKVESIINELLQQNVQLRFDLAVLRALITDQQGAFEQDIDQQMIKSQSLDDLSPEVIEMLSKFDFK